MRQRLVVEQLIPGVFRLGPPVEWQIVGVSRDMRNRSVRRDPAPEIDVPFWQSPGPRRASMCAPAVIPRVSPTAWLPTVQSMDPDLAMEQVRTMDQLVDESLAGERFSVALFAAFAAVALTLAAIGIYGVMSFAVAQRTHEIGLRMALGAGPRQVLRLVLREGLLLALAGLVLGLIGTYFVGRVMASVLYGVTGIDPLAVSAVAILLLVAAVLACYVPANRATRVDPLVALRHD